jgi:hypothetical protein
MKIKNIIFISLAILVGGCEKDITIDIGPTTPQLIVEAYISNQNPLYTYVVLSNSSDFYSPNFQSAPAKNAVVTITEGTKQPNGTIIWDNNTKVTLQELNLPQIPQNLQNGLYMDSRVVTNFNTALRGTIGKQYRLDIKYDNKNYTGFTELLQPVMLDSVSSGFPFVEDNVNKVRLTVHYKDPDTIGNAQFYYWRNKEFRNDFGWAGLRKSRTPGRDDNVNGQYIRLTFPQGFDYNDTVDMLLTSVSRQTHTFWESYLDARNNNGPFATPVTLKNYIQGENVIGCFMGLSVSEKRIITK